MAQVAAMHRCDFEADNVFGPRVVACRDNFDFTLFFEQTILSIFPAIVALVASTVWTLLLWRQDSKIKPGAKWRLRAAKQIPILIYLAIQLALTILWASPNNHPTSVSIPSAVVSLVTGVVLSILSYVEHTRSVRPSSIISLYLSCSILLDTAQCRTLWLRPENVAIASVFTASIISKSAMLSIELMEKRKILDEPYASYPPEAIGGIINRSVFWWINSLLISGSSTRLGLNDLFDLDVKLTAGRVEPRFMQLWRSSSKTSSYCLLLVTLKNFLFQVFTIVLFRLCLIGFKFSQPLLIHRAVSLLEEPESQEKTNIGRSLIGATSLIYIGIALTTGAFRHNLYRLITMTRSALVGLVYNTTLRLDEKTARNSAALTLMSTDIESIATGFEMFDSIWADPIEIAIAIYLLYRQVGLVFVAPVVTSLIFVSIPITLRGVSASAQKAWLESIERRVATIASVLSNMKGVKMTGLSVLLGESLQALRVHELKVGAKFRAMLALSVVIGSMSHVAVPVMTLIAYTLVMRDEGNIGDLTPAKAFTALSLVSLLAYPIQNMAKAMPQLAAMVGCFQRIQQYVIINGLPTTKSDDASMASSSVHEKATHMGQAASTLATGDPRGQALLIVQNANLAIRGANEPVLRDISFNIRPNSWTIIAGPVGSGKSVLLLALLDELSVLSGSIDRVSLLQGGVGYCAQDAWLPNLRMRDIISGHKNGQIDETWYNTVLDACALRHDLEGLPAGDHTEIGTNGVSLSGGQRQRVSLARAIYSRKPLLILDDVLSGLDPTTEKAIVDNVFGRGGLLRKHAMTAILATHSVRYAQRADHVIFLGKGGVILEQGPPSQLSNHLTNHNDTETHDVQSSTTPSDARGVQPSQPIRQTDDAPEAPSAEADLARQTGDLRLYAYYFRTIGWVNTIGIAIAILTYAVFQKFPTLWVQWWTAAEADAPGKQTDMYAGVYGAFCAICLISFSASIYLLFQHGIPRSSMALHGTLLKATLDAPYWFFVSTDIGDIINRFSQDMSLVSMQLPITLIDTLFNAGVCIVGGVLITMGSKWSLTIYPGLVLILYLLQRFYLRTSRQMRLLDLEAKAPLYSFFLETLNGIVTIRAFGWQSSSEERNARLLDISQQPFYLMYSIQRWLNLVLDLLVTGVAVMIVALSMHLEDSSAGALGVSLLNILTFSQDLTYLIRTWTELETSLGAVARVKDFEVQTPSEHMSEERICPPESWPSQGNIEFRQVSASYRSGSEKVLDHLSLKIPGGSKVGICGRTGSGKSTFILTLLRLAEIESGQLFIDDLAIDTISRTTVRQRVVAVPQDPLLLPGTIRFNADPCSKHQDLTISQALDDVGLLDVVNSAEGGLDSEMDSLSLSKGQQQLFCLARALLGDSRIIVLDEMTSSVDAATEEKMMTLVSKRFADRTVLAIAHHLHTIRSFDMIIVLDHGRIVETGSPEELLSRESAFWKLWKQQG